MNSIALVLLGVAVMAQLSNGDHIIPGLDRFTQFSPEYNERLMLSWEDFFDIPDTRHRGTGSDEPAFLDTLVHTEANDLRSDDVKTRTRTNSRQLNGNRSRQESSQENIMPFVSKGKTMASGGEPVVSDGEPVVIDGEPVVSKRELFASEGEPVSSDGEPVVNDGEPIASDGEPVLSDGEPVASDGEPVANDGGLEDGEPTFGLDPLKESLKESPLDPESDTKSLKKPQRKSFWETDWESHIASNKESHEKSQKELQKMLERERLKEADKESDKELDKDRDMGPRIESPKVDVSDPGRARDEDWSNVYGVLAAGLVGILALAVVIGAALYVRLQQKRAADGDALLVRTSV